MRKKSWGKTEQERDKVKGEIVEYRKKTARERRIGEMEI